MFDVINVQLSFPYNPLNGFSHLSCIFCFSTFHSLLLPFFPPPPPQHFPIRTADASYKSRVADRCSINHSIRTAASLERSIREPTRWLTIDICTAPASYFLDASGIRKRVTSQLYSSQWGTDAGSSIYSTVKFSLVTNKHANLGVSTNRTMVSTNRFAVAIPPAMNKAELGSNLSGVTPGFSHFGIVSYVASGGRFILTVLLTEAAATKLKSGISRSRSLIGRSKLWKWALILTGCRTLWTYSLLIGLPPGKFSLQELNPVSGEAIFLNGKATLLAGEATLLTGEAIFLAGEAILVVGEATWLAGETILLAGEATLLAGVVRLLAYLATLLSGEAILLAGETILLTGEANYWLAILLAYLVVLLAGEAILLADEAILLVGEAILLAGEAILLAHVAGVRNTRKEVYVAWPRFHFTTGSSSRTRSGNKLRVLSFERPGKLTRGNRSAGRSKNKSDPRRDRECCVLRAGYRPRKGGGIVLEQRRVLEHNPPPHPPTHTPNLPPSPAFAPTKPSPPAQTMAKFCCEFITTYWSYCCCLGSRALLVRTRGLRVTFSARKLPTRTPEEKTCITHPQFSPLFCGIVVGSEDLLYSTVSCAIVQMSIAHWLPAATVESQDWACILLIVSHWSRVLQEVSNNAWTNGKTIRLLPSQTGFDYWRARSRIVARGKRVGRCRWSVGFLGDLPFPPPLHSGAASYSPRLTLIGFQDLNVKRHPKPSIRIMAKNRRDPVSILYMCPYTIEYELSRDPSARVEHLPKQLESSGKESVAIDRSHQLRRHRTLRRAKSVVLVVALVEGDGGRGGVCSLLWDQLYHPISLPRQTETQIEQALTQTESSHHFSAPLRLLPGAIFPTPLQLPAHSYQPPTDAAHTHTQTHEGGKVFYGAVSKFPPRPKLPSESSGSSCSRDTKDEYEGPKLRWRNFKNVFPSPPGLSWDAGMNMFPKEGEVRLRMGGRGAAVTM
ncbi:hypothetical protein PR048_033410 [Dryococelus australis]|uniref:Uncharacterized protein n=1 Tax=Dryococelus australis TaxID=614101 RepID=A0ABQ9G3B2_9NEOP|nr:hypothetical protein PR048_033410 [Dryococelus australis]